MLSKGKFTENSCVLDNFYNFCDAFIRNYNFNADYLGKIKELRETYPDDVVLNTGSLYFVGLVKRELAK